MIPGSGRFPGEGNGNPLQYYCLENPMDRGAWWATVHGVAKSRKQLSDFTFTSFTQLVKPFDTGSHALFQPLTYSLPEQRALNSCGPVLLFFLPSTFTPHSCLAALSSGKSSLLCVADFQSVSHLTFTLAMPLKKGSVIVLPLPPPVTCR